MNEHPGPNLENELSDLDLENLAAGKGGGFAYRGPFVGVASGPNRTGVRVGRAGYYSGPNVSAVRGPFGRAVIW